MDSKRKVNLIVDRIIKKFGIDEDYNILGFKPVELVRNKVDELQVKDADEIIAEIKKIVNS
jgi:hypothetical protein